MKLWMSHGKTTCTIVATVLAMAALSAAQEKDFATMASAASKEQLKKFGPAYTARTDAARHLIYISALDDQHLQTTMELLASFSDAYRRTLDDSALPWGVTVILPTVDDYRPLAPAKDVAGFYRPGDRTLISIDRGRVLLHEFTHALHGADAAASQQVHPIWVREGLATLMEDAAITPSGLEPRVDLRLLTVQKALKDKTLVSLDKLIAMGDKAFTKDAVLCYAQSRYLMLYLYQQGKLNQWYRHYKAGYGDDTTGLKAMEKVQATRIWNIETSWLEWLAKLRLPVGEIESGQARLGIEVKDDQGAKVVSLAPGGAAATAQRIQAGDTVERFNGQAVHNTAELVAAIRAAGAMQTVAVDLLRQGHRITIQQPLGAPQQ